MKNRLGLVHIYTGNGKGKSTTAFGMALRAVGQNLKVKIIQFLKGGCYTGEYIAIQNFLNHLIDIEQYGKRCIKEKVQVQLAEFNNSSQHRFYVRTDEDCGNCRHCFISDTEEKQFVQQAFNKTKEIIKSGEYDLIFLDEINNCVAKGLLPISEIIELIQNKPENTELILTGRNAPEELKQIADLVTNMDEVKHPMSKGVMARRGIEF